MNQLSSYHLLFGCVDRLDDHQESHFQAVSSSNDGLEQQMPSSGNNVFRNPCFPAMMASTDATTSTATATSASSSPHQTSLSSSAAAGVGVNPTTIKTYKCRCCPKEFTVAQSRLRHEATMHQKELAKSSDPVFKCSHCKSCTQSELLFRRHMARIHPELVPPEDVSKFAIKKKLSSPTINAVQNHRRSHGDKPLNVRRYLHSCPVCGVSLESQQSLVTHCQRVHDKQLLKCRFCDYKSSRATWLYRHQREQHKEAIVDSGDYFSCSLCDAVGFVSQKALTVHQQQAHKTVMNKNAAAAVDVGASSSSSSSSTNNN